LKEREHLDFLGIDRRIVKMSIKVIGWESMD
jgi:hypothetical protein